MCMLIRLLGRFSLRALQNSWSSNVKQAIEDLAEDDHVEVKEVCIMPLMYIFIFNINFFFITFTGSRKYFK